MAAFQMFVLRTVAIVALLGCASACVYKYGEDPEHPFAKPGSVRFTYEFAGLDWDGTCATGQHQSPINIPRAMNFDAVETTTRTIPDFGFVKSNGTNVKIFNNLHVVQMEWSAEALQSNVTVALPNATSSVLTDALRSDAKSHRAPVTPLQFHFHAHSEHGLGGAFYPLELHIVSHATSDVLPACTGKLGCLTVVGIMFALDDDDKDNQMLSEVFNVMPSSVDTVAYLPQGQTFDLNSLLPANKSYVTYSGSLTTPPCSEEVLWHLMLNPLTLSSRQLQQFLNATGDMRCEHDLSRVQDGKQTVKPAAATNNSDSNAMGESCVKLGAGQNYRIVQPIHERTILMYIDESPEAKSAAAMATSASGNGSTSSKAASAAAVSSAWISMTMMLAVVVTSVLLRY